jgi:DNA-binding MarR family transcriptional regulator
MKQNKFIKFREETIKLFNQYGVSIKLNAILCFIVESHYRDHQLTVTETISQKHIASQATLHANIKELITLNLVEIIIDNTDARIKFLKPTKTTLELFKKLDNLI